jgi:hypothetical protein
VPTWGEILVEIQQSEQHRGQLGADLDGIRRKYLAALSALTGRSTVAYYTDWINGGSSASLIVLGDMQGMMEVLKDLKGPELDIVLHSPGGSAEAAASIVRYLRKQFTDIRVFVPLAAMSAATMWALACNRIVMGKHSQLGPIDPQMITPTGQFPARGIVQQFERAKREVSADPSLLGAWVPILQQYGPALLEECEKAEQLARSLVAEWLRDYMFAGKKDAADMAEAIATWFSEYGASQSHSLGIDRDKARAEVPDLVIENLEDDQDLQDAVLSVHHSMIHTLSGSAVKIVENHIGKAFVSHQQVMQVPVQIPVQQQSPIQLEVSGPDQVQPQQ